jgi:hypothetical protein
MAEFGEMSAVALDRARKGRCPLCGRSHAAPKHSDAVYPVKSGAAGWMRGEPMSAHNGALPGDEMHHCVAFSAFHVGAKKRRDFVPEINRLLHERSYTPNRELNCVALPGRAHERGSYGHFWARIRAGEPLQLHIGRHKSPAINAGKAMVLYMLRHLTESPGRCEQTSSKKISANVMTLIGHAEKHASDCTLRYVYPFQLHPTHMLPACAQFETRGRRADPNAGEALLDSLIKRWGEEPCRAGAGNPFSRAR